MISTWALRKVLAGVVGLVVFSMAGGVFANALCGACKVQSMFVLSSGRVAFSTGLNNAPVACGTSNPSWLIFDPATAKGKALLSLVQAAMLAGREINAYGSGTCTSAMEELNEFTIRP
jgi:hypothetical protein